MPPGLWSVSATHTLARPLPSRGLSAVPGWAGWGVPGLDWFPPPAQIKAAAYGQQGLCLPREGWEAVEVPSQGLSCPAQSPGPLPQDKGNPKTDSLEPGTAPMPPRSLEHIRVARSQPPPGRLYPRRGPQRRVVDMRPLRGGAVGPQSPPHLCPSPLSGARLGGGCPGFSPADGGRAAQGLVPLAAMLVRGSPGAHRSGGCSL